MLEHHLEKLQAFHATATEGSFVRAAQMLGVSQPAVTKTVRNLESHLSTTLLVRNRKGITLTASGVLLKDFCEQLFYKTRDIEQKINAREALSGVIKIATYETLGELFWPKAINKIKTSYPDLVVELTTENPETHWHKIDIGSVDLIVDAEPRTSDQYFSRPLYTDQFGIFCKKGSPLLEEPDSFPVAYVKRATDRRGVTLERYFMSHFKSWQLRYSVESFTMVRSLILEGVCYGVLPLRLGIPYVKEGDLVQIGAKKKLYQFGEHRICVSCLDDMKNDGRILTLTKELKTIAHSQLN